MRRRPPFLLIIPKGEPRALSSVTARLGVQQYRYRGVAGGMAVYPGVYTRVYTQGGVYPPGCPLYHTREETIPTRVPPYHTQEVYTQHGTPLHTRVVYTQHGAPLHTRVVYIRLCYTGGVYPSMLPRWCTSHYTRVVYLKGSTFLIKRERKRAILPVFDKKEEV